MQLHISTSPRATWVWAPDAEVANRLQGILSEAGCSYSNAVGKHADNRILDLDIGVVALDGLNALADAGYTFRWHPKQHSLNRGSNLYGMSVSDG